MSCYFGLRKKIESVQFARRYDDGVIECLLPPLCFFAEKSIRLVFFVRRWSKSLFFASSYQRNVNSRYAKLFSPRTLLRSHYVLCVVLGQRVYETVKKLRYCLAANRSNPVRKLNGYTTAVMRK